MFTIETEDGHEAPCKCKHSSKKFLPAALGNGKPKIDLLFRLCKIKKSFIK